MTDSIRHFQTIALSEKGRWADALKNHPHSFGHTWESCHLMSLSTHEETFLLVYDDGNGSKVVCPFSERIFDGSIDITTPYGFSGFSGYSAGQDFSEIFNLWARNRNYVCSFVCLNPFLPQVIQPGSGSLFDYNDLFTLEIDVSDGELLRRMSENRRREINKISKVSEEYTFDKQELIDFLVIHHHQFIRSRSGSKASEFSAETLRGLSALNSTVMVGVKIRDRLLAVSVFAIGKVAAEYLFNVSVDEGQRFTTALIWKVIPLLRASGVSILNLGGGISRNDSVAEYKKRFGAKTYPLRCLKQVHDRETYEKLCVKAGKDPHDLSGYFPAYHRSLIQETPQFQN